MNNPPPRNPNPDLQAPFLDSDSFDEYGPINNAGPERRPSYIVRENLLREMQMRIYGSIIFCLSSITLSVFKTIISSSLLAYDKSQCNQPLDEYFTYMIINDVINCMVLIMRLATIIAIYGGRNLDRGDVEGQYYNIVNPHGGQVSNIPRPILSVNNLTHERVERFKWRLRIIAVVFGFNNFYYCLLFVYAHFIYFQPDSNCAELASYKNGVMLSYIILGYIFVGLPTLSFFLVCFCLPCLLLGFYFMKKKNQAAANKLINKLPVKKYTSDLSGNPECSICMVEYKNQDDIVQLQCSPLHYFHEDCIKKWLRINQHCPICRQSIKPAERELRPVAQNNPHADVDDLEAQRLREILQRRYS